MSLPQTKLDSVLHVLTEHLERPLENYRRSAAESTVRGGAPATLSITWALYDAARHVCAELGLDREPEPPASPEPVRVAVRIAAVNGVDMPHQVVLPLYPGQTFTQQFDVVTPGSGVVVPCTLEARL